jgi:hypothetical protein
MTLSLSGGAGFHRLFDPLKATAGIEIGSIQTNSVQRNLCFEQLHSDTAFAKQGSLPPPNRRPILDRSKMVAPTSTRPCLRRSSGSFFCWQASWHAWILDRSKLGASMLKTPSHESAVAPTEWWLLLLRSMQIRAILDRSKNAPTQVIRLISATLRASGAVAYVLIVVLMPWWPSWA